MSCAGNPGEICGGSWSLSVYSIDCSSTSLVATPKQGLITTSEVFTVMTTRPSTISDKSTMMSTNLPTTSHISTLSTELTAETTKPASLESSTDKPQFDIQAGVASNYSVCSCADCLPSNTTILTEEEVANKVTLLKNAISINKKETNFFKNTKRSANDSRKSARNLGIVGIIVMMFPVIFVVVIDILSIFTVTQPVAVLQNEGL
ncbi:uncharacterized protein [Mytilus edulis]|uniref:uncharacterized protein n=1 Tax=Mytilus edulis TaxID=6550 RepID=UPI0039F0FE1B